ncbi:hypothetical protein TNIN_279841 [Trichonephila inaurata madagascariensis]|uniref:Uncharacterized protein n=1 Tax=Trichonephila inaurata madagascariensis TaxID=2747483 RepID=A0A8X6XB95_9ARAC|nr:hypothetical protein TNIN_279841 [Trichonephila inaurata madagascariensis]
MTMTVSFVDFPVLVSGDGTFRISKPSVALPSLWRSAESLIVLIPEYSPTHSPIHSGILSRGVFGRMRLLHIPPKWATGTRICGETEANGFSEDGDPVEMSRRENTCLTL